MPEKEEQSKSMVKKIREAIERSRRLRELSRAIRASQPMRGDQQRRQA